MTVSSTATATAHSRFDRAAAAAGLLQKLIRWLMEVAQRHCCQRRAAAAVRILCTAVRTRWC